MDLYYVQGYLSCVKCKEEGVLCRYLNGDLCEGNFCLDTFKLN